MEIRILPSNVANAIAAGEVVQRPASVVKELVENAVDAGATQVTVVIKDAGRTLIQVIDNGCGMSPDDAVLCFERHATSKIASADDLMDITTFGFRGEALASIAAVAEVTLRTRREEDEIGCEVQFSDSLHRSTEPVSAPRGSNFQVRNLFYNVPARRKFLKSDNVEFKHIVSEFTRVALTRPDIGFSLTHNDRDVFVLKPAKSLKFRIQDLLGTNAVNEVVDISVETSVVTLTGYVGRPDLAKKSLGNQFFFVNGRYFRSPYLHKAVMKGYENLIPDGVTPSYFLYLEVDPHTVDVNIHPTKTEIKFEDESVIFQIIYAGIRETLGKNSFAGGMDFERDGAPQIPVFTKNFEEFHPVTEPSVGLDPTFNPFENDGFPQEDMYFGPQNVASWQQSGGGFASVGQDGMHSYNRGGTSGYVSRDQNYGKLFEERTLPTKAVLTVQNKYILTSVKSGVLVINVRRARERILYERFLNILSKNGHQTQTTLFPVTVQVGVENMMLFKEHSDLLASLGFDISPFGNDTVVVNGVPEGYSAEPGKVQSMVSDLMFALADDHTALGATMASSVAERFARLGASSGDGVPSGIEAQRLIDSLFACENAEYTSSGHKIMSLLTSDELEKRF
ncbi:MAG: DNA mismatch repair endonuclease MutL [Candidatus Cryptobacteroides sp.]